MLLRTLGAAWCVLLSACLAVAAGETSLPVATGELLYENDLAEAGRVDDWRMEGPGEASFADGWLQMRSPGEKMHHVFWCPQRFPESFVARWEAQNLKTEAGLCIVFFAAAGREGQSIFADGLPERDGTFRQYTKGAIRCYHASYYANAAHNPDRGQTNLRKNPGFHLVQEGREGIPTESTAIHTITLAKEGPRIRLWVDERKVLDWTDTGETGGPPHGDGFLGFRQMRWTHLRYRNLRVWAAAPSAGQGGRTRPAAAAPRPAARARAINRPAYRVPRLAEVRVDGAGEDWGEAGFRIRLLHRALADDAWQPRGDADLRLGWDDEGLLILATLTDDVWTEDPEKLWRYDSLELYMAPRRGSPQTVQVVIGPGMSESLPEPQARIHDHRRDKRGALTVDVARTREGRRCVLEARLPWANLGIEARAGATAAFQVMRNDNDQPGSEYGATRHDVWYRALGAFRDSRKMHTLQLAAAADPPYRAATTLLTAYGEPPVLRVDAVPALAGSVVRVEDGAGAPLAEAALAPVADAPASRARLPLDAPDASLAIARLDDRAVGAALLYGGLPGEMEEAIRRAGNAASETERYRILRALRAREDLPALLREDLRALLPVVDWWANGRRKLIEETGGRAAENGYLCRFFYPDAKPGNDWPGAMRADSPLYPLRAFYRARALVWTPIQIGAMLRKPAQRERWYGEARKLLAIAGAAYPENEILGMYLGEAIPWPAPFDPDPRAPAWANLQREGLEKLADVIHWWIDNRQVEDGQYGGGWGDDVEMWRWWTPLLVAFRDPKITAAQARLSRSIFAQPHLAEGYTSHVSDVEHTAEDTADTVTPMIFLEPENPLWRRRALRIVELAGRRWMGENERGFLQFKSTWFSAEEIDLAPQRACDTVYHPRVFHPALVHWLRSGDERVARLIVPWMETWVDAAARAENGKPAGILPSALHWPDGEVGGGVEPWWRPQNYRNDLYAWPSAMSLMTRTLLLTYHMTGEERFLAPIRSMAAIRREVLADPPAGEPAPGSAAWCALQGSRRFGNGMARFLPETLAKLRLLTGDPSFDDLLEADAGGYMQMRLGQGREALTADLRRNAEAFRINRPGYTSEVRWTDRVLRFNERWGTLGVGADWPGPDPSVLYATATGDPADPRYFPMNAVRWLIEPRAFAALVVASGRERFAAELYNFRAEPRTVPAELYLLAAGAYRLRLAAADGAGLQEAEVVVEGPRTPVTLELPPRTLCRLTLEPLPAR